MGTAFVMKSRTPHHACEEKSHSVTSAPLNWRASSTGPAKSSRPRKDYLNKDKLSQHQRNQKGLRHLVGSFLSLQDLQKPQCEKRGHGRALGGGYVAVGLDHVGTDRGAGEP